MSNKVSITKRLIDYFNNDARTPWGIDFILHLGRQGDDVRSLFLPLTGLILRGDLISSVSIISIALPSNSDSRSMFISCIRASLKEMFGGLFWDEGDLAVDIGF